jgi:hypothetical protein
MSASIHATLARLELQNYCAPQFHKALSSCCPSEATSQASRKVLVKQGRPPSLQAEHEKSVKHDLIAQELYFPLNIKDDECMR